MNSIIHLYLIFYQNIALIVFFCDTKKGSDEIGPLQTRIEEFKKNREKYQRRINILSDKLEIMTDDNRDQFKKFTDDLSNQQKQLTMECQYNQQILDEEKKKIEK